MLLNISKIVYYSIHVVHWILGFSTLVNVNGKYEVFGIPIWITFIIIIYAMYDRMKMILFVMLPNAAKNFQINAFMYMSMKFLEIFCASSCWLKYSKWRSADLIKFNNNLIQIDKLLKKKQSDPIESVAYMYYVYFFINILYNMLDYVTWKKGYVQFILMYEMMAIDLTMLMFIGQMNSCILRMRVLNNILYNTRPKRLNVDFRNCRKTKGGFRKSASNLENSIVVEAYERIKKNVLFATDMFGPEMIITIILALSTFIIIATIFVNRTGLNNIWNYTSVFCWATRYVLCLVGTAYYGELFLDETMRMKELIGKRLITKNLGTDYAKSIHMLRKLISIKSEVPIAKLFNLDFLFITKILGISVSYAIIIIQCDK